MELKKAAVMAATTVTILAAAALPASASTHAPRLPKRPVHVAHGPIIPGGRPGWCLGYREVRAGAAVWVARCGATGFRQIWTISRIANLADVQPTGNADLCLGEGHGNTAELVSCSAEDKYGTPLRINQIGTHNAWEISLSGLLLSVQPKLSRPRIASWQKEKPQKWVQVWALPQWGTVISSTYMGGGTYRVSYIIAGIVLTVIIFAL